MKLRLNDNKVIKSKYLIEKTKNYKLWSGLQWSKIITYLFLPITNQYIQDNEFIIINDKSFNNTSIISQKYLLKWKFRIKSNVPNYSVNTTNK